MNFVAYSGFLLTIHDKHEVFLLLEITIYRKKTTKLQIK